MKVFLSIGHSGGQIGAVANGTTEFDEVLNVGTKASQLLIDEDVQVELVPTHLKLPARIQWINQRAINTDILLELHMDSATPQATGCTIFYFRGSDYARDIAKELVGRYAKETGLRNRGVKEDTATRHKRLGIVADTKPIAFLLELGFITNQEDLTTVRHNATMGVVNSLLTFMEKQPIQKPQEIPDWAKDAHLFVKNNKVKDAEGKLVPLSDGLRPNDMLTRAEAWVMLHRLFILYEDHG